MAEAQLTEQDVFTHVYTYFSRPGVELGKGDAQEPLRCQYRWLDGRRCGVGCLLTEEELQTLDFARSNTALCAAIADQLPERLQSVGVFELLQEIQHMHDRAFDVQHFLKCMRDWAAGTDLVVPDVPA